MGLLNWMRNGFGEQGTRLSPSPQSQVPIFERLEPRILLSGDTSFVPDFQPLETFEEPAISVDVNQGSGIGDVSVTVGRSIRVTNRSYSEPQCCPTRLRTGILNFLKLD